MSIKEAFSGEKLEKISELLISYIEVRSELIKIQIKEQIVQIISQLVLMFIFLLFGFLIITIASFAISFYLNEILDSSYIGFVILSGIYILLFIILFLIRKKIIRNIVLNAISEEHFNLTKNND